MHWVRRWLVLGAGLGLLAGGSIVGAPPASAAPAWSITPSANPAGALRTGLNAVACPSATRCFAVGAVDDKAIVMTRTDGDWSVVASPNPNHSSLAGVACPDSSSCFAVGTRPSGAFFMRWNGTGWAAMKGRGPNAANLLGISCVNRSSCVAVGYWTNRRKEEAFAAHWTGRQWNIRFGPNPKGFDASYLGAVSCPTAKSCFAVGERLSAASGFYEPFLVRWTDKTGWRAMVAPKISDASLNLTGVSCPTTTRCVAVGWRRGPGTVAYLDAVIAHWNGRRWSVVANPTPAGQYPSWILSGVSCAGPKNCFAVGFAGVLDFATAGARKSLAEHWDGHRWSIMDTPNPSDAPNTELNGVACRRSGTCFSVGEYQTATGTNSFAEAYA